MTEELEQLLKNLKLRRILEIYDEQLRAADSGGGAVVVCKISHAAFLIPGLLESPVPGGLVRVGFAVPLPVARLLGPPLPRAVIADLAVDRIRSHLAPMIFSPQLGAFPQTPRRACRPPASPLLKPPRLVHLQTERRGAIPRRRSQILALFRSAASSGLERD